MFVCKNAFLFVCFHYYSNEEQQFLFSGNFENHNNVIQVNQFHSFSDAKLIISFYNT